MRAESILRRVVAGCGDIVHQARFEAVLAAAAAITRARRVSVTEVGRSIQGKLLPRHGIKKVDRLLSNWRLHRELSQWYRVMLQYLLGTQRRVSVLVDWTKLHGDLNALTASIPFLGRSIPILSHVHPKARLGARNVHDDFLAALRAILPPGCSVVIVADGGFRSPFFEACERFGFPFVIRLRNDRSFAVFGGFRSLADYARIRFSELFAKASETAQCLGAARPYGSSSHSCFVRLVLGPRPRKARLRQKYSNDYERKRACEPFLLATNLENDAAETIVRIYSARMQIEETFRDVKSPRFGLGLEYARISSRGRFEVLLLLVSLAFVVTVLVGATVRETGYEAAYRSHSGTAVVLSVFTLGALALRRPIVRLRLRAVESRLKRIRAINASFFPKLTPPRSENRAVPLPLPHGLFCADCGWNGPRYGWPR